MILIASDFDDQTLSAVAWLIKNDVDIQLSVSRRRSFWIICSSTRLPFCLLSRWRILCRHHGFGKPGAVRSPTGAKRRNLPRMKTLIEWGLVSKGDTLVIDNHNDSDAKILDQAMVKYKDQTMTFNEWGSRSLGGLLFAFTTGQRRRAVREPWLTSGQQNGRDR